MKFVPIVLLLFLISCRKENVYYYADKKPVKDSTVNCTIANDGKYTYFIYISGIVVTDLGKKEYKIILLAMSKRIGIQYYNAIRK